METVPGSLSLSPGDSGGSYLFPAAWFVPLIQAGNGTVNRKVGQTEGEAISLIDLYAIEPPSTV